MKKEWNFGILGCGSAALYHADAIKHIEGAKLIGVADNNFEAACRFGDRYSVKAYESYEDMLADDEIDAVCICTPSNFHAKNAADALNNGKNVVLEKPMALTVSDAEWLTEIAEKSQKLITVISQLRFNEDLLYIKDLISKGAFGKLCFCDLYMKYWRDKQYFTSSNWRGKKEFERGGAIMNQGIHGVDIMLYMVGDAEPIFASCDTNFHNIEIEDRAVAVLQFENGAKGVLEASTCSNPGFERRIEITGSNGSAILIEGNIEKLVIGGETLIDEKSEKVQSSAGAPEIDYIAHAKQLQNFVNALNGEEKLLIDAYEGQKAVRLIEKIYLYSENNS